MKKTKILLSITLLALMGLSSCGDVADNRVPFSIGNENMVAPIEINESDFKRLIEEDKENIVLYVYTPSCVTCNEFTPILENYISEKHLTVYKITFSIMTGKLPNKYSSDLKLDKYAAPNLSVWKEGKLIKSFNSGQNAGMFSNGTTLKKELEKIIVVPRLIYISKETLDAKIAAKEKFVIYYARLDCGDCGFVKTAFLESYLPTISKVFYALEVNVPGIRLDADYQLDTAQWQQFKDDYGLSNTKNPLGYGVGYVPTFHYYEDGKIKAMSVYLNDTYTSIENGNGTKTYTITDSYYPEMIGKSYTGENYRLAVKELHNTKLQSFLDVNLPKCN